MSCKIYEETIAAAMDVELSDSERDRLDRHLAGCASCRSLSDDLLQDRQMLASPTPWGELDLEAIRKTVTEKVAGEKGMGLDFRYAWAATLLLALALVWLIGSPSRESRPDPVLVARHSTWAEVTGAGPSTEVAPTIFGAALAPPPFLVSASAIDVEPASVEVAPPKAESLRETTPARESMVIQLVSTDPDLVIYWLIDPKEDDDEYSKI